MLSVENLVFSYGTEAPVLNDLSLCLESGEVVSLLGPSGCGKSTVLRIVANLLKAEHGQVQWHGEPNVAFVFQDPALMPWATVQQNVTLPSKLKGNIDYAAAEQALAAVGLDEMGQRYPAMLSGGQRMRVSVARALTANPKTLLMDEPFAALDEILRFQMNDLLLGLVNARDFGVLFVTHSLYEAAYLSDRVLVMSAGRIVGEVLPGLDRALTSNEQRGSPQFMQAVEQIAELMKEAAS